jgi:hypothetical protein
MVPEMSVFGAATGVWAKELTEVESAVVAMIAKSAKIETNLLRMFVSSLRGSPSLPDAPMHPNCLGSWVASPSGRS